MQRMRLFGLGGQGVVTAARILVHAVSIFEDKFGKTIPAYGHERRGAPVWADVMIDHETILLNSFVYKPDVVVVFTPSVIDHGIPIEKGIHQNTILLLNSGDQSFAQQLKRDYIFKEIYYVDATQVALEQIGREIPNSAMLGAVARAGIVGISSAVSSLKEFFKNEQGEKNAAAAREAYERTRKI